MTPCPFRFHDHDFVARISGALHWPTLNTLIVADLHLGKSGRMARRGGALLPPFETRATLERLEAELRATAATRLICLGDSFDDDMAIAELGEERARLERICTQHDTLWITGNHDPAPEHLPGLVARDWHIAGLTLRHIAGDGPDISGHYHPKLRIAGQRLPAFLIGHAHLILPAFGAYTGGLDHDAPVLSALVPEGRAIVAGVDAWMVPLPLPRLIGRGTRRFPARH
jgi:DNA ligase-associated metallophosphoesterase